MRTTPVNAVQIGMIWRVLEDDETPAGSARSPSDGGGFADQRDADRLAALINGRRAAAGRFVQPEPEPAPAPAPEAPKPARKRKTR